MKQVVHKRAVQKASPQAIRDSFSALAVHLENGRWLGQANRYRLQIINRLQRDTRKGRKIRNRNLAQYIAASAPLHCADGWTYLGRAIDCHSRGDSDSARHLAYYAELRAAISLLATEGIGIFNNKHFNVTGVKACGRIANHGTHLVAWHALRRWSELQRAGDLFGRNIMVRGIRLREWIGHFRSGPSLQPTGKMWLQAWGLDLERFSKDQEARNESSYRPTALNSRTRLNPSQSVDFVSQLWSLCEPSGTSRFEKLDRHLLRLSLEYAFRGATGTQPSSDPGEYKKNVSDMIDQVIPGDAARNDWEKFLTREIERDDPVVLTDATRTDAIEHPRQHLQMISRASLLLRVAAGACSSLLAETDTLAADVRFWWRALGLSRGLWTTAGEPPNLTDLWADVDAAIGELHEWEASLAGGANSLADWWHARSYQMSVLGTCERIALWGLGL